MTTRTRHRAGRNQHSSGNHAMEETGDRIINRVKAVSNEALDAAEKRVHQARKTAASYVKAGRRSAGRWERSFERQLGKQPIKSLLAASACGFLMGVLFARR